MSYFYFAATLPELSIEQAPPLSSDAFTALCRENLSDGDFAALEALSNDEATHRRTFVRQWKDKETQLRNALVRVRASELKRDPGPYLREQIGADGSVDRTVGDAFGRKTPQDRELVLDRFRWTQAEALAGYDPFSIDAILAYSVKLKLAERWAGMDEDAGRNKADEIVSHPHAAQSETQEN
jgi:hypothetical protein